MGNDSAPMHPAAAGGVPVVKICGLGAHENPNSNFSPERFGPWNVAARVVRPPALFPNPRHSPDNPALNIGAVGVPSVLSAVTDLLRADQSSLVAQTSQCAFCGLG